MVRSVPREELRSLLSDKDIAPFIGPPVKTEDLIDFIFDKGGFALSTHGVHGAVIFVPSGRPGLWEAHTAFSKCSRGEAALRTGREAVDWLFTNTDADTILGFTPVSNRAALRYARAAGMVRTGETSKTATGEVLINQEITRTQWASQTR